jgi:hypothetical protein
MSRLLRRRLAALTIGGSLLAGAVVAGTASGASADTVINAHYTFTGSSYIKKLNTTINIGTGTLAATVDLTTGTSTSTLTVPPSTISMKEFGFIPVTVTTQMVQNGPATGTANLNTNTISSTSSVILEIASISVAGINIPVGNSCQTSPFSVTIASDPGFTISGGGPISGSFTISNFHHCGITTPILNLLIPGPGNTLNLTLGPLQIG